MIRQSEAGVRGLQEDVARDPGSPSFVPLADLYRAQGRLDVARRVCSRGLERHPHHVEAHYLLGRIHRDSEDSEKAFDEWDIALSLDPQHLPSRKALAFLLLEQGDLTRAEGHLRQALASDPDDPRLRRALRFIEGGGNSRQQFSAAFWDTASALMRPRLEAFARGSRSRSVVILDTNGRVLAEHGLTRDLDVAGFASLAAGIHAASRALAMMLEQPGFSQLYQGRGEHQLLLGTLAGPASELLLLAVFGTDTTVGLVRTVYRELARDFERMTWPSATHAAQPESLEAELAAGLARLRRPTPTRVQNAGR
jgi:tetratricopeptide (TPR) repeat protein